MPSSCCCTSPWWSACARPACFPPPLPVSGPPSPASCSLPRCCWSPASCSSWSCRASSKKHKKPPWFAPGRSDCRRTYISANIVGATFGRPPKNIVFRIFRRKISLFSPCGDGFCLSKIHGRPRVAPTGTFLKVVTCFDTRGAYYSLFVKKYRNN